VKSKFITDLQDAIDSFLSSVVDEVYANFFPSAEKVGFPSFEKAGDNVGGAN
jgi:hypothetical protein